MTDLNINSLMLTLAVAGLVILPVGLDLSTQTAFSRSLPSSSSDIDENIATSSVATTTTLSNYIEENTDEDPDDITYKEKGNKGKKK